MPTPVVVYGSTIQCPHGGKAEVIPVKPRVLVGGMPLATAVDPCLVVGCVFSPGGSPHPCVQVRWTVPAVRVLSGLVPVVLQTSTGLSLAADQAPQGPPIVVTAQTPRVRVLGT